MAIRVDERGRPLPVTEPDPQAAAERDLERARRKRLAVIKERAQAAGIEAQTLEDAILATDEALNALEVGDVLLDRATDWYSRGFTRPVELAALLGKSKNQPLSDGYVRGTVIPAVLRRLASDKSGAEKRAAQGAALSRHMTLLKYAWNEMMRAGKPSVKAQWAQVVMNSNREIDKLDGVAGRDVDQKVVLVAINAFIESVVGHVEGTNDPALMHRVEEALERFLRAKQLPLPELPGATIVDAELVEGPGEPT